MYEVLVKVVHDTSGLFSVGDITDRPSPTITIGVNSLNASHFQVYTYLTDTPPLIEKKMTDDKPPYIVPSMADIKELEWNGYTVASTFSGCGGSCLGYRMAGYRVLWASEFVPEAQEAYLANSQYSYLDRRDIREVQAVDVLERTGLNVGELDIFDGSPPCDSFSTAGKREKLWGKKKAYHGRVQRSDDLFFEYARLVRGLQPKVFVAENVSGLVKGTAKGYFKLILKELRDCGYKVEARLLDAQWLGVPQARQRIIFIGVRNDLGLSPVFPKPLSYNYSVRDAIPWITAVQHGGEDTLRHSDRPSLAIMQPNHSTTENDYFSTGGFIEAETDISKYAIGDEWDRMGGAGVQSDKYFNLIRPDIDKPCPTVTMKASDVTAASVVHPTEKRKFSIAELKRICAFPDDFVLPGSYTAQWARLGLAVPPVMMFHIANTIRGEILDKVYGHDSVLG